MHEVKKVHRAGTIPYYVDEDEVVHMMFMKPSDPVFGGCEEIVEHADGTTSTVFVSRYQLAKGKVEDGESYYDAAIRESKEELGLFVGNIEYTEFLGTFMGRTHVYVSKINDVDMFGEPSFETESVVWMTLDEFLAEGRDLHKPTVQAAHRLICQLEKL